MKSVKKTRLIDEIKSFKKYKIAYAIPIMFVGLLGLVLPVIPGILLIGFGLLLVFPGLEKKLFSSK